VPIAIRLIASARGGTALAGTFLSPEAKPRKEKAEERERGHERVPQNMYAVHILTKHADRGKIEAKQQAHGAAKRFEYTNESFFSVSLHTDLLVMLRRRPRACFGNALLYIIARATCRAKKR
jgi:hypothetical protein